MDIRMAKRDDEIDLACPHCGTEYTDADQGAEAGEAICAQSIICGHCRNPFEARRAVQFTYRGVIVPVAPQDDAGKMRAALEAAAACFDAMDPRQPSGLSDAETASLFNSTREAVRLALLCEPL